MKRKVALGIILALVLVGGLNVPLALTEVGVDYPNNQIFKGDDVEPFSVGEDLWNFSDIIEWSRFAYANDNSAEVVIGLSGTYHKSYDRLSILTCKNGGEIVNTVSMRGKNVALVVNVSVETASSFVESVRATGLTKYIEPNMRFQAQLTPNDPDWSLQWGPRKIEAHYAWNTTIGDPSVLVTVIDTGIDYNHLDLVDNYVALGHDWVNNDTDPMDDHGHGTHCAGIIAATLDNSIGIAGVAQVRIMAEKGLDSGGSGSASDLANAIIHAVDQGADIISNSWGGSSYSNLIHDAVKYAQDRGVLVLASAGNEAVSMKHYPAAYDEVVAVTATAQSDDPASFTSYGKWVDVAAPGVDVYSTFLNNGYEYKSGTSMACPHAAGVAALIWSEFPSLTLDEVRLRLQVTADDLGDPSFDVYYGYGRVNARRAVKSLPSHDLLILNWKRPAYVEPGSSGIVNTTVVNFGGSNEAGITVQLRVNGSVVDSAYISYLGSMKSTTVSCSWSPTVEGRYCVESYVVPVSGENLENNVRSTYINVRVGNFIRVPEDCSRIQEAVDLASPRETIKVASGTYYERVSIDLSLKLVGEDCNTTVIDGNGIGAVVGVTADNVVVRGFTVQNSGDGLPRGGIVLLGVKNCEVTDNTLINDFEGVLLWECTGNNSVYDNIAFSNEDTGIGSVFSAGRDTISDNVMIGGQFGIAIVMLDPTDPSSYNRENTVSRNMITNSEYGIGIVADNNTVANNNITLCSDRGIWLGLSGNTIRNNRVENNERGIVMEGASSSRIYHNDFIHNTIQAYFSGSADPNTWDDGYPSGGNHWNDYTGVDANQDGIGDTPYLLAEDNIDRYPLMYPLATPFYGPLAKFTYSPKTPYEYETVTFDASASLPGWNGIARVPPTAYTWDFDDGNITTVTDPVIYYVFMVEGVYTVNLTVTCDDSVLIEKGLASDSTWQDVSVTVINYTIRADGSIFPSTAPISSIDNVTYTFTGNSNKPIVVERNNIVVDGAGYKLQGTGSGTGIDLTKRRNVTIKNMKIKAFRYGINLYKSSNNTISGNNITANNWAGIYLSWYSIFNSISGNNITDNEPYGIRVLWYSSGNIISGNTVTNSHCGIEIVEYSNYNSISGNTVTKCFSSMRIGRTRSNILSGNTVTNNNDGVWLWYSFNNSLSGNVINGNNESNFGVWGNELSNFMHSIDVSNLVNGKPIYYLVNQKDLVINSATHPQVGYLALINCTNVTVKGLTLTNNGEGLLLAHTSNSRITDNSITNNDWGIGLSSSLNNSIYHNNFVNNTLQVCTEGSTDVWDDGYPSGGNYWSDYKGLDANQDGIGDTPYIIDWNNKDNYPLMHPWVTPFYGPTARFTYSPPYPYVNNTLTFDASISLPGWNSTTEVPIVSYEWDFGDGYHGQSMIVNHTYTTFGTYNVTLTVRDIKGFNDTTWQIATVINYPVAFFTYEPNRPIAGDPVTFNASLPITEGGMIIRYDWDFGDGNTANTTIPTTQHTYATRGTYNVTLTAKDIEGLTDTTWQIVTVRERPVAVFVYIPQFPLANETVTFDASASLPGWNGTSDVPIVSYEWDFGDGSHGGGMVINHVYTVTGTYTVTLNVTDSEGLWNTAEAIVQVGPHDVAITNVIPSKTVLGQGYWLLTNVTVANEGDFTETFNVTAYANTASIATRTIILASGKSITLFFAWNTTGFAKGVYAISASATQVPGERDTGDNSYTDGTVRVNMVGDLNSDGKVTISDIVTIALAFGSQPGDPNWNPNADISGNGKVTIMDIVTAVLHFGEKE